MKTRTIGTRGTHLSGFPYCEVPNCPEPSGRRCIPCSLIVCQDHRKADHAEHPIEFLYSI